MCSQVYGQLLIPSIATRISSLSNLKNMKSSDELLPSLKRYPKLALIPVLVPLMAFSFGYINLRKKIPENVASGSPSSIVHERINLG